MPKRFVQLANWIGLAEDRLTEDDVAVLGIEVDDALEISEQTEI